MSRPFINQFRERNAAKRDERSHSRARLLEVLGRRGEAYCVEVAADLFPDATTVAQVTLVTARVKSWLVQLEDQGVLVSRLEASPTSGNGRRYFRLATPASAAAPTTNGGPGT